VLDKSYDITAIDNITWAAKVVAQTPLPGLLMAKEISARFVMM
jgi:hypothetical protein